MLWYSFFSVFSPLFTSLWFLTSVGQARILGTYQLHQFNVYPGVNRVEYCSSTHLYPYDSLGLPLPKGVSIWGSLVTSHNLWPKNCRCGLGGVAWKEVEPAPLLGPFPQHGRLPEPWGVPRGQHRSDSDMIQGHLGPGNQNSRDLTIKHRDCTGGWWWLLFGCVWFHGISTQDMATGFLMWKMMMIPWDWHENGRTSIF